MERVFNFSAGPAAIDPSVLQKAADEMVCYGDKGMSVLEMSHRTPMFMDIYNETLTLFRDVMGVPEGYEVLFLQGGATMEFAAVPLNLMTGSRTADYLDTGNFAHLAAEEAKKYGTVNIVASSRADNYTYIPDLHTVAFSPDADYAYITTNNTIYGTEILHDMEVGVPLVADMSSDIFSRVIDVSKYAIIYGGAQKNLAPAGVTFAIVKDSILGKVERTIPTMLKYSTHISKESMFNTPPVVPIFAALQTLKWIKEMGGVAEMEKMNIRKSNLLYSEIDRNSLFQATVPLPEDRSRMNVCFVMTEGNEGFEKEFNDFATERGMIGLKGHRSAGGFRASLYNAMPYESVEALVAVMKEFEASKK